ncbi:MAG: Uma2 family endonuclease [Chloroflexota bacterium]|nr:Uma2 family endonuclease [Chloroflexota bacterium]MDE2687413.1 Uma2 family endonuclease [Chloroflexota bacterium]
MTTKSAPRQPQADKYAHIEPLPDPPRVNDMEQFESLVNAAATLGYYFRNRNDVLVSGEGYLRRTAAPDEHGVFPDCVVATGVEDPRAIIARNGYVISEVGKPPDFVLEVASRSTGRRDYTVKREIYASFGIPEYWRFDHTGGSYHDAPLAGDELVDGVYRPTQTHRDEHGVIWGHSFVLGLDLCWVDKELRLRDPTTGEFLPTPSELADQRDAAQAERDMERAGRMAAEDEAAMLREQLRRMQQD